MAKSSFQFIQPVVTMARFEMLRPVVDQSENKCDVHIKHEVVRNKENNSAYVQVVVQVNKKEEEIIGDALFYIEIAMQSAFKWDNSLSEEDVDKLLKYNATALLISYIRPIIVNMTYMSPVSTINLPYINLNRLFEEKDS